MNLTDTQKRVLLALNAYPTSSDKELAKALNMKRSTVTVARHHLKNNDYYTTHLFPNYKAFDVNLLAFKYGDYGRYDSVPLAKRKSLMDERSTIEETVFSLSSDLKGFSLFLAKNLGDIKSKIDHWNTLFEAIDTRIHIRDVYIPTSMVKSFKLMEGHELLAQFLEVLPLKKENKQKFIKRKLSKKETEVLLAWFANPKATNETLAQKISVSRAVIGAIKKRLIDEEIVHLISVPSWEKLGFDLGVLTYIRMNAKGEQLLKELEKKQEVLFMLASDYECVFFTLYEDYHDYEVGHQRFLSSYQKDKIIIKEPEDLLFTSEESNFLIDALPFLRKRLEEDKK